MYNTVVHHLWCFKGQLSIKGRWALNSEIAVLIEKQNYKTKCVYYFKKKKEKNQCKKKNHTLKEKVHSDTWSLTCSVLGFLLRKW